MSLDAKLQIAADYKQSGSEFVKDKQWQKALGQYTRVYAYITGLQGSNTGFDSFFPNQTKTKGLTELQIKTINELSLATHLNCALCHLKLGRTDKALEYCDKALKMSPSNVKALGRKGAALIEQKQWDDALEPLLQAQKEAKSDASIAQMIKQCREAIAEQEKARAKQYAQMFQSK